MLLLILNICCAFVLLTSNSFGGVYAATGPQHDKVVVCYIGTWAVYRPERGSFTLDHLDPNLCTHIVYAFAGLNATTSSIKSLDPWQDMKEDYGKGNLEKVTALKIKYPHLKVTLAIGGWNEGSANYSIMAGNPASRQKFVMSVVQFLKKYNFDGLDLDWEYPGKRGGKPEDKQNFVSLARELKEEFKKHKYILTAALGASKETIDIAYDVPKLSQYLDLIHMMCYDYHGAWDSKVGSNAPLHPESTSDELSVESTVEYMLKLGAPPEKLVMGVPFYGRTFIKQEPSSNQVHVGASAQSTGFQGPFTREAGFMGYNEICLEMSKANSEWKYNWDGKAMTPYIVDNNRVIVYDNQRSLVEKVRFAMNKHLRGVMVWSIDTDDFHGDCKQENSTYVDFQQRLNQLKESPFFTKATPELETIFDNRLKNASTDSLYLTAHRAYKISTDGIIFIQPLRMSFNYPLLRTLNEALELTEQESIIMEEIEKFIKMKEQDNEIIHGKEQVNNSAAMQSVFGALLSVTLLFVTCFV